VRCITLPPDCHTTRHRVRIPHCYALRLLPVWTASSLPRLVALCSGSQDAAAPARIAAHLLRAIHRLTVSGLRFNNCTFAFKHPYARFCHWFDTHGSNSDTALFPFHGTLPFTPFWFPLLRRRIYVTTVTFDFVADPIWNLQHTFGLHHVYLCGEHPTLFPHARLRFGLRFTDLPYHAVTRSWFRLVWFCLDNIFALVCCGLDVRRGPPFTVSCWLFAVGLLHFLPPLPPGGLLLDCRFILVSRTLFAAPARTLNRPTRAPMTFAFVLTRIAHTHPVAHARFPYHLCFGFSVCDILAGLRHPAP